MKIAKKNVTFQIPFVNPIIDQERPFKKIPKKGKYIVINYHNTTAVNVSESYEISLSYYGGGSHESGTANYSRP